MLSPCCSRRRKNTESKSPKTVKTKNGRIMLLLQCAMGDNKLKIKDNKWKFIKEQETSGSLFSLGIKAPLSEFL